MSPRLFLGFSGISLPPGDNLAGFQPVDWDILAAIQLLISPQAQSSRVLHGLVGLAMCVFSQLMTCLCQYVCALCVSTARHHIGSLDMKHDTLINEVHHGVL